jgi:hypothetical protein
LIATPAEMTPGTRRGFPLIDGIQLHCEWASVTMMDRPTGGYSVIVPSGVTARGFPPGSRPYTYEIRAQFGASLVRRNSARNHRLSQGEENPRSRDSWLAEHFYSPALTAKVSTTAMFCISSCGMP